MLTLVIQAGGQSQRMGHDKALLPFRGEPLIQRVINRISHLADEILITTNRPEGYHFLGVPLIPDVMLGTGALGGLYTALKAAKHPLVGVVACDLPFANPHLLRACQNILNDPQIDAVIPSTGHGLEPLHAIYRRETCLPAVERALKAGKRRVVAWHKDAVVRTLSPEETAIYDPQGITFINTNTPEEFNQAEKIAQEL